MACTICLCQAFTPKYVKYLNICAGVYHGSGASGVGNCELPGAHLCRLLDLCRCRALLYHLQYSSVLSSSAQAKRLLAFNPTFAGMSLTWLAN